MTLRDNLLPSVERLRGIAGKLGFRRYRVEVVKRSYANGSLFDGASPSDEVLVTIGNAGQNVKVRRLTARDYLAGAPPDAELRVGPITPAYQGGGIDYETLTGSTLPEGSEIYYRITSDEYEGSRFQRVSFQGDRALGYYLDLRRISDE